MEIDISRTPANATITGGPSRSSATPSVVTFSFVPQVNSSVGAPIASAQCLIQDTANQPQVSTLGRPGGPANTTGNVNVLLESIDAPATPSAFWANCSSPVIYKGLQTGNYTFQVRMLDMAGNLGNATQLYAFAVDASLPLPGSESAGWFSGWRKWAVIAGAAALGLLLLLGLSGACYRSTRRARQAAAHAPQGALYDPYDPATPYRQGAQDERALHAALHRSLAERQRGVSDVEEHLRSAIAASLEEERLRLALERSMVEQHSPSRKRHPLPAPREDSDPELRRALQASLEEERLRRAALNSSTA